MKLHLANLGETKLFTAHEHDAVMVNRQRFSNSIVVQAQTVHEDWNVTDFTQLTAAHFDYFLPLKPDVLLIGTGAEQHFPHPRLYRQLADANIAVEFMDTPAACRTYNILVAEGRKVIAGILL
ncbi:MAG: Mth938-like domain-containing protein [Gallionella sp.]